jgi:hypothetical protein
MINVPLSDRWYLRGNVQAEERWLAGELAAATLGYHEQYRRVSRCATPATASMRPSPSVTRPREDPRYTGTRARHDEDEVNTISPMTASTAEITPRPPTRMGSAGTAAQLHHRLRLRVRLPGHDARPERIDNVGIFNEVDYSRELRLNFSSKRVEWFRALRPMPRIRRLLYGVTTRTLCNAIDTPTRRFQRQVTGGCDPCSRNTGRGHRPADIHRKREFVERDAATPLRRHHGRRPEARPHRGCAGPTTRRT